MTEQQPPRKEARRPGQCIFEAAPRRLRLTGHEQRLRQVDRQFGIFGAGIVQRRQPLHRTRGIAAVEGKLGQTRNWHFNFFTGSHDDYHRPTDTAEKLNYEGMERIAQLARGILLDLAGKNDRPDYAKVDHTPAGPGSREDLRAYLGTIPDYAAEVAGVKLSGVRGESPAEKSGLKGGDIIVGFGGMKIANIYDYTYALDAAKIGQAVAIEVVRGGERLTLTVTPEVRK